MTVSQFPFWWAIKMNRRLFPVLLGTLCVLRGASCPAADSQPKKLILMAGKPSHPPRMHEFNAGVQLLAKCLSGVPSVKTEIILNGWPKDETIFDRADAVVFYMDGGAKHEAVQEDRRRLDMIDAWTKKG